VEENDLLGEWDLLLVEGKMIDEVHYKRAKALLEI